MRKSSLVLAVALLALTACTEGADGSRPDYRIGVMKDPETGKTIAVSKPCPEWNHYIGDGFNNQFNPQFGCAQSQNLAKMIDRPNDLVYGRPATEGDAGPAVLGIERYRTGKTKELMNPKEGASTTGD
jgi:hypothetical protein